MLETLHSETMSIGSDIKVVHNYNRVDFTVWYDTKTKFYYASAEAVEFVPCGYGEYSTTTTHVFENGYTHKFLHETQRNTKTQRDKAIQEYEKIKHDLFSQVISKITLKEEY